MKSKKINLFICVEIQLRTASSAAKESVVRMATNGVVMAIDTSGYEDWGAVLVAATDAAAKQFQSAHDDIEITEAVPTSFNVLPDLP